MSGTLLDYDRFTGITETFNKDAATGKFSVTRSQDTSGILNENAIEKSLQVDKNWKGDMHKVASIPLIVWEMWINELKARGATHCDPAHKSNKMFLVSKLNNRDFSKLRTKEGRV